MKKENKVLKILFSQLNSFIVYILIVAVVISLIVKEFLDASVIGAIIILNIILGFIQEYRAEKSLEALKKLETSNVKVLRNNKVRLISSKELVLGDIILIDSGMKIPADSYLFEAKDVEVNESILTGESTLVKKFVTVLKQKAELAEQINILFSSTTLVNGRAKAIVVNTGMNTEVGKIATLIQEEKSKVTPLQNKLKTLGLTLGIGVIIIALIILFSGVLEGQDIVTMLLIAISLAVAAVPEGLPAVVTISLAIGVQKMIKKNVLIRKLASVETLGSTTVIAADKTGTITQNKMKVTKLYLDGNIISPEQDSKNKELMLKILVNCNDAHLPDIGDPTEIALLEMSGANSTPRYPRIDEIPFTSERKYMITFHKIDNKKVTFAKFAPERIYELCNYYNYKGRISKFTLMQKQKIIELAEKFANQALRVLGCAYHTEGKSKDMIFLGLVGMIDPPREE
ncbi:MAG: HAD-IC family P-type ATPase, partial [Nanoarchaeota archaeon]